MMAGVYWLLFNMSLNVIASFWTAISLVIRGCAHLCNHIILVFYFYSPFPKRFQFVFNWVVQVIVYIKGGKSSEMIYIGLIFLHHWNLALTGVCRLLYPLYILKNIYF